MPRTRLSPAFPCDVNGNPLAAGVSPLPMYRDAYSGKTYVRVVEVIPSGNASADKETAAEINALNPIHYTSTDGDVRGYFVEAPDFKQPRRIPGRAARAG